MSNISKLIKNYTPSGRLREKNKVGRPQKENAKTVLFSIRGGRRTMDILLFKMKPVELRLKVNEYLDSLVEKLVNSN